MPKCTICSAYTKFEGGLCYKCYKEKQNQKSGDDFFDNKKDKPKVNNDTWVYNLIKGRIAETIIEELFLNLNFQVFKYGMENSIPGIMDLLKGVKDDVAMEIRRMPDLVVYKDGKAHFIEVKFRASEKLKLTDIDRDGKYPYRNALFVLVSKKHIKCISYSELKNGKEITPTCRNYLGKRKEFETDKQKIIDYCDYAVKFFENV